MKENTIGLNRKLFLELVAKGTSAFAITSLFPVTINRKRAVKAIAFDAFTLFDTSTVFKTVEQTFPGKAKELMQVWRTKQFEYTWLRGLSKQYKDFGIVTADSLRYATDLLHLDLTDDNKKRIMQSLMELQFTKNACAALIELKRLPVKLSILSNATAGLLNNAIEHSSMQNIFDAVLSTDSIRTYKPDPAAYRLATDFFNLEKEEILFVAFGGWDAAGAKSFGFHTAWMNTMNLPPEQLDVKPDFICEDFIALLQYAKELMV